MQTRGRNLLAILSDKPTKNDLLNFKDYSNLLTEVIMNSETPSTIGVFGDWGSGKTSLMLMIDDNLQKYNIKTIWFNAWKYDKDEALWRSLILSILRDLSVGAKKIDEINLKLYAAISTEKLGKLEIDWLEVGKSIVMGVAFFAAPLLLIPGVASLITNSSFFENLAKAFSHRRIRQSQERISSIEQFEELYKQLIAQQIKNGDRIVVFIDDLDRCLPLRALEVIEALKSFLDAGSCVYVVACDTRLINQGLIEKYSEQSRIELDEYLGKIIQFAFTIPPIRIEDAEGYVKNLGWLIGSDQIIGLISTTLERNPRKLKRFLTDLSIKSHLVGLRELDLTFEVLVTMSCVAHTWKNFWLATLNNVTVFLRAQELSLLPNDTERSQDDIEFSKLFQIDERLNSFLRTSPKVSPADLHEYIFLATATSSHISEIPQSERAIKSSDRQRGFERVITDQGDFYPDDIIMTNEMNFVLHAINEGKSIILVEGQFGTGKTTLLYKIDEILSNEFVSIYVNLSSIGIFRSSTIHLLYEISRLLKQGIDERGYSIRIELKEKQFNIQTFEKLVSAIILEMKDKRLVIMFDDFGAMFTDLSKQHRQEFAQIIENLVKTMKNLTFILCSHISLNILSETMLQTLSQGEIAKINLGNKIYQDLPVLFERIISIRNEDFKMNDAYQLVYLLEIELRYLIITLFNSHDWWQVEANTKLFARALDRSIDKEINNEEKLAFLSLSDLFQLIVTDENWKALFVDIFNDKKLMEEQRYVIVRARNSIMHSRELEPIEMQRFVVSAKDLVRIIHSRNFS